jgi:hypothetical protein
MYYRYPLGTAWVEVYPGYQSDLADTLESPPTQREQAVPFYWVRQSVELVICRVGEFSEARVEQHLGAHA